MDKTVKDILSDLNTESKEKSNQSAEEVGKKLFSLGCDVYSNETLIFKTQWTIEENRRMILNNYHSSFSVNTKLANNNTKEIFENRESILSKYNVVNEVESNYIDFLKTKTKLDLLEHRIGLNKDILEISNDMSKINKQLIDLNKKIMKMNSDIVEFNKKQIETNQSLVKGNIVEKGKDVLSREQLIEENKKLILELEKKINENEKEIYKVSENSLENANKILRNRNEILERRDSISNNSDSIQMNKSKIFYHF